MVISIKLCSGGLRALGLVSLPLCVSDIFLRKNAKYQSVDDKYVEDLWNRKHVSHLERNLIFLEHKNIPTVTPMSPSQKGH